MLKVEELTFKYPGAASATLKSLDLILPAGTHTSLIGANGAGKSTLLKILAGIFDCPGMCSWKNTALKSMPLLNRAQCIAYVQQLPLTAAPITVFDLVLLGRHPYSFRRYTERDYAIVTEVLDEMGIQDFADRDMRTLSGGERQLVSIARALAQEPELLLLDEPTSSLDLCHQQQLMSTLQKKCRNDNLTIISSIHDLNLAIQFADSLIFLAEGKIISHGPIADVLTAETIEQTFAVPADIHYLKNKILVTTGTATKTL